MKLKKRHSKGFSLIELLIVVAIILIIAAIAIPNLMQSKIAANQASAVGSLRTINTAETTYNSTYNTGFSASLGVLGAACNSSGAPTSSSAGLIDCVLSNGGSGNASTKSGYSFTYSAASAVNSQVPSYTLSAVPINSSTGQNGYYTDQSDVIRYDTSGSPSSASTPIG